MRSPTSEDRKCHSEKPIFLAIGSQKPTWTPDVIPMQLVQIGKLLIVALPAEVTTISGLRIRKALLSENPEINHVVIAGLANDYSGYLTTAEEYTVQHYEGAQNAFGPHALQAYIEALSDQVNQWQKTGHDFLKDADPTPHDSRVLPPQKTQVFDEKIVTETFGKVLQQPKYDEKTGIITVKFRSANPINALEMQKPEAPFVFFEIQKYDENERKWKTHLDEDALNTSIRWYEDDNLLCRSCLVAEISWNTFRVASYQLGAQYRFVHSGRFKNYLLYINGYFQNVSEPFQLP